MYFDWHRIAIVGFLACVVFASEGCGPSNSEATEPTEVSEIELQPTDSFAVETTSEKPEAVAENKLPAAKQYEQGEYGATRNSEPEEVCNAFVRALHERNTIAAERLLTLTSRVTLHDKGLELDALAGENAQYVIGDAKYTTSQKDFAYVDCHITEPAEQGELNFVVRWMLKPEPGYGWRVFGMVMEEQGQLHKINFESSEHAAVVNEMYAAEQQEAGPEVRQANQPGQADIR